jgi:hypothetical protein
MRTTLTLEDDVARKLEEEQRRTQRSFKDVVNDALRVGLALAGRPQQAEPFVVQPHSCGGVRAGIDPNRLNQLLDDLEADHFLAKHSRGQ